MLSITYVSSAAELLTEPQLLDMLRAVRAKNQALGLTGMMLYRDGNIIQALEGPDDAVVETYAKICADPRHHGIIELLRESIAERTFAQWTMGFRYVDDLDAPLDGFSDFLRTRTPGAGEAPGNGPMWLLGLFRQTMR
ncbi:BLUF domain-containing protein [Nocardioides sp. 31GB23]|uniref:BLUF domain-containing protein n=1 Tax=Nocardioides sp. 31GB23 TaxID=3156065 RepID=UPI0032AED534